MLNWINFMSFYSIDNNYMLKRIFHNVRIHLLLYYILVFVSSFKAKEETVFMGFFFLYPHIEFCSFTTYMEVLENVSSPFIQLFLNDIRKSLVYLVVSS